MRDHSTLLNSQTDVTETSTLPFVTLAVADLTRGRSAIDLKVVEVDGCGEHLLQDLAPQLNLSIPNCFQEGDPIDVQLVFRCWDDFTPVCLAEQIPAVRAQIDIREGLWRLRDLCRRHPQVSLAIARPRTVTANQTDDSSILKSDNSTLETVLASIQESVPAVDHPMLLAAIANVLALREPSVLRDIYGNDVLVFIAALIDDADRRLSRQLHAVMLSEKFVALSSTWLGVKYLCEHAARLPEVQLKVVDVGRAEFERLAKNPDQLKNLIDSAGSRGQRSPISLVVADFEIGAESMPFVADVAKAAQSSLAPFVLNASPNLFGLADWSDTQLTLRLDELSSHPDFAEWQALTSHEDSKLICLACPEFHPTTTFSAARRRLRFLYTQPPSNGSGTWIRAAWGVAARIHDAMSEQGLPYRAEGMTFGTIPDSDSAYQMSMEGRSVDCGAVRSTFSEPELQALVNCGVSPVLQVPTSSRCAIYFLPSVFRTQDASPTRCRFLEVLCGTRLVQHVLAQFSDAEWVGGIDDTFDDITNFLANYVLDDPKPSMAMSVKYPLTESAVEITRSSDENLGSLLIRFRFQANLFAGTPIGTLHQWRTLGFTRELLSFPLTDLNRKLNRLKS